MKVFLAASLNGIVYHVTPSCRALRGTAVSEMPEFDAKVYFGRSACYICKPVKKGK